MRLIYIYAVLTLLLFNSCSKEFLNSCDSESTAYKVLKASFTKSIASNTITLTNTSANAESYLWEFGNEMGSSTESNPAPKTYKAGKYLIKLTAKRCGGELTDTYSEEIEFICSLTAPTITRAVASESSICSGKSTKLIASACTDASILWATGETTTSIDVTKSGTYSAQCQNSTCRSLKSNELTVTVITVAAPSIVSSASAICINSPITLTASGCSGIIKWSTNQTGNSINQVVSTELFRTATATCTQGTCVSQSSSLIPVTGIPLAKITTVLHNLKKIPAGYDITFNASIDFNTPNASSGEVQDHGFVYVNENTDPLSFGNPLKISKGALLERNTSTVPYTFKHNFIEAGSNKYTYRAYIKKCDGQIIYGLPLKTF